MTDGLPVPLSASKLKQFDRCPEAFRIGYIDRKPGEGGENYYIRRGNAVHEAIEDVLGEMDTLAGKDTDYLRHKFREQYRSNGGPDGYDLSDDNHQFVLDCLAVAARFAGGSEDALIGIESKAPFRSAELDHDFTGYIDVATETEVWDWKTGKSDGKDLQETLQGSVYMAGYYAHTGRIPEAIHFAYLKDEVRHTLTPSDELWATVVDKASALLKAIDLNSFPADPGDSKCHWCDYEVHCTASSTGGGGIDWEAYP